MREKILVTGNIPSSIASGARRDKNRASVDSLYNDGFYTIEEGSVEEESTAAEDEKSLKTSSSDMRALSSSLSSTKISSAPSSKSERHRHQDSESKASTESITMKRSNSNLSTITSQSLSQSTTDRLKNGSRFALQRISNLSRASFSSAVSENSSLSIMDSEDPGTRLVLLNTGEVPEPVGGRSHLQSRRLEMMEGILRKITDSETGIPIKTRMRNFKSFPLCALGNDITTWIFNHCNLIERWEAFKLAQQMLESGYLIPAEGSEKFEDSSTLFSFQNIYFWPSKNWNPSDLDYAAYLLRRSGKSSSTKGDLNEEEETRFRRLNITLDKEWMSVFNAAQLQKRHLESIDKLDRRMFLMREAAFWRLHRPLNPQGGVYTEIEERKNALSKVHMTDGEYEATLTPQALLKHVERRLYTLHLTYSTNRNKASISSKNLIERCQVWEPLDPFLQRDSFNPFIIDDREHKITFDGFNRKRSNPTKEEADVWSSSLRDLLNDSLGVEYFLQFLKKEYSSENLKFWLRCSALDNEPSREEWVGKAKEIYNQFISPQAEFEINIDAQVRDAIMKKFKTLEELEKSKPGKYVELDVNVYSDAMSKIFNLMEKDSYSRFLQTIPDLVQK